MRRGSRAAAALVAVAATALGGCSEAEDAVDRAAGDAACRLAQEAVDGVAGQAREAADRIGADPEAARRELTALRDSLAAAEEGLSGETRARVEEARAALDRLVSESRDAARGAVDEQAVEEAERELDTAVEELTRVC